MCQTVEVIPDGDLLISLAIPLQSWVVGDDQAPTDSPADGQELNHTETEHRPSTQSVDAIDHKSEAEIRFKVSSKHLTIASPRFHKMLSGDWIEAKTVYLDGCRHVHLEADFDSEALRILLAILHGKTRAVPRSLDLEMLTKVAVLVDDFGCHEAVDIWSDMWIQKLENPLPTTSGPDLISWITISVVFHKPAIFEKVTRVAILNDSSAMNTTGLPVPQSVDESVNRVREESIQHLLNVLYRLVDDLREENDLYTFEDRCLLLGALLRQMGTSGIPWSRPEAPFSGFSFTRLDQAISSFQTPDCGCNDTISYSTYHKSTRRRKKLGQQSIWGEVLPESLSLYDILTPEIGRVRNSIKGLNLEDHSRGALKDT